jgi:VanZ family protein
LFAEKPEINVAHDILFNYFPAESENRMPLSTKTKSLLFLLATAGYWLVIFGGTHIPGNPLPGGGHRDKVAHFCAYAGLAFLLCGSVACFRRMRPGYYAAILGLIAVYGIVDELTQLLVPHRTADPLDWLADMSGAIFAILSFLLLQRFLFPAKDAQGTTG